MHREQRQERTGVKQTGRATAQVLGLKEDNYRAIEYDMRALSEEEARTLEREWGVPWRQFYLAGWKQAQDALARSSALIVDQLDMPGLVAEPRAKYSNDPASPRLPLNMGEVEVPLVGSVKASGWDSPMESNAREPIPADQYADDVFCSYIVGPSMESFMLEDDLAVWKIAMGRQQVNDVVYAVNNRGEVTTKQLKHDGQGYYLHPLNPEFSDMRGLDDTDPDAEWKIHGILVALNRFVDGNTIRIHNPKRLRPK